MYTLFLEIILLTRETYLYEILYFHESKNVQRCNLNNQVFCYFYFGNTAVISK